MEEVERYTIVEVLYYTRDTYSNKEKAQKAEGGLSRPLKEDLPGHSRTREKKVYSNNTFP